MVSDKGTLAFSFIVFSFSALQTERNTFLWSVSYPSGIFLDKNVLRQHEAVCELKGINVESE